jgi:tetratricopeptide (TPR) repeat protein
VCLSPIAALGNQFDAHYKRGMVLYEKKNYEGAAAELLQAYELRQLPRVLLNLGTIYRKMGKATEALSFYERYLKAEPHPPEKIKKDLDEFISQTRALVEAPEIQAELERRKEPGPVGWNRDTGEMEPWLATQIKKEDEQRRKFYRRPWFWGVVGGVVAAGIITGVTVGVIANQRAIPSGIDIIQFQLTF